jgi:hypothetical protein
MSSITHAADDPHAVIVSGTKVDLRTATLARLARIIRTDWWEHSKRGVYFGAEPYLDAMLSLDAVDLAGVKYGMDDADVIVAYFLANAQTWRGPVAKAVKAELRRRES